MAAVGILGTGVLVRETIGSDHQQTALTELNPQIDINDTYAFPGSTPDRTVLGFTVASPLVGNKNAIFDPNALYQIKVDNNQDGREDLVFQFSFDLLANGDMRYDVIGPVPPRPATGQVFQGPASGLLPPGVRDYFSLASPVIRGAAMNSTSVTGELPATGTVAAGQIQAFAGLVDDPFYVDLEQFFRIIPDRRPTQGPLGLIGGVIPAPPATIASAFRPACTDGTPNANQGAFASSFGCAVDFLSGFNALAIVVEVPTAQLMGGQTGNDAQIGVWATVSQ